MTETPLPLPAMPMPKTWGYEAQPGRRCGALAGFGFSVLMWVTLFHPLEEAEPRVRTLVDPRRRHPAPLSRSPRARTRLRLHGVRGTQVARHRDLPRRALGRRGRLRRAPCRILDGHHGRRRFQNE